MNELLAAYGSLNLSFNKLVGRVVDATDNGDTDTADAYSTLADLVDAIAKL